MREIHEMGAAEAARAIRAGALSSEEITLHLAARIARYKDLNAFSSFNAEYSLAIARERDRQRASGVILGPLHGVPVTLKDNIDVAGLPTSAGTPGLRTHVPTQDSPVVAALVRAGAIVFGKNNMHELAFGVTSNNGAFGAVRNPYDPSRIPGGSSGGTAAAVAARMAPVGLGSDTGGSVRVPAALCGVFGMRPTLRRWSQDRNVPIAHSRDTLGPIARSVEDLALLDGVVTSDTRPLASVDLQQLRLGLPGAYFWESLDPETERICRDALATLRQRGVTIVEADLDDIDALNQAVSFVVALYEFTQAFPAYLRRSGVLGEAESIIGQIASADVQATLQPLYRTPSPLSEAAYLQARDVGRPRLMQCYIDYFAQQAVDAVLFPCTPLPAQPIGQDDTVELLGRQVPTFPTFIRNTDPGSNAGLPGVTIPVGMSRGGLPVGLAIDGPPNSDRHMLAIAAEMATLFPPLPAPRG